MKNRVTHSLIPMLLVMMISACGDEDKGPGIVDINDVVDEVDTSGGSGGGGGGVGGGGDFQGTTINRCTTIAEIPSTIVINDELNATDCSFEDIIDNIADTRRTDGYVVTLGIDGAIDILMRSADFDSRLFVFSCADNCGTLTILSSDDDSGGGVNGFDSLISISIDAGTYLILASKFEFDGLDGDYTLEVTFN